MKELLLQVFKFTYGVFTGGLLLLSFYNWFALPVFTELPTINFYQAIGLNSLLYLFNKPTVADLVIFEKYKSEKEENDVVKYGMYMLPWVILGLGYLVKLFIG